MVVKTSYKILKGVVILTCTVILALILIFLIKKYRKHTASSEIEPMFSETFNSKLLDITKLDDENSIIMLTSDMHIEPWLDLSSDAKVLTGGNSYNVYRMNGTWGYNGANHTAQSSSTAPSLYNTDISSANSIWGANNSSVHRICNSDAPIGVLQTAVNDFVRRTGKAPQDSSLNFFFCGDTKAHNFGTDAQNETWILSRVLEVIKSGFHPNNIFYVPGNKDGISDQFFYNNKDPVDVAWAQTLIKEGIVDINSNPYFLDTAYYVKQIPNSDKAVACVNSMFAGVVGDSGKPSNIALLTKEMTQLGETLESIRTGALVLNGIRIKYLFILSHYPMNVSKYIPSWNKSYSDIIISHFCGHFHDPNYDSQSIKTLGNVPITIYNIPPLIPVPSNTSAYYTSIPIAKLDSGPLKLLVNNNNKSTYDCLNNIWNSSNSPLPPPQPSPPQPSPPQPSPPQPSPPQCCIVTGKDACNPIKPNPACPDYQKCQNSSDPTVNGVNCCSGYAVYTQNKYECVEKPSPVVPPAPVKCCIDNNQDACGPEIGNPACSNYQKCQNSSDPKVNGVNCCSGYASYDGSKYRCIQSPPENCCIQKGKDACSRTNMGNQCNFTNCVNNIDVNKNNCCSKSAILKNNKYVCN